jgi:hypothetical protein
LLYKKVEFNLEKKKTPQEPPDIGDAGFEGFGSNEVFSRINFRDF